VRRRRPQRNAQKRIVYSEEHLRVLLTKFVPKLTESIQQRYPSITFDFPDTETLLRKIPWNDKGFRGPAHRVLKKFLHRTLVPIVRQSYKKHSPVFKTNRPCPTRAASNSFWQAEEQHRVTRNGINPPDWRKRRYLVYERDQARCQRCGLSLTLDTCDTHHLIMRGNGGDHGLTNLVTLCRSCHSLMPAHSDMRLEHVPTPKGGSKKVQKWPLDIDTYMAQGIAHWIETLFQEQLSSPPRRAHQAPVAKTAPNPPELSTRSRAIRPVVVSPQLKAPLPKPTEQPQPTIAEPPRTALQEPVPGPPAASPWRLKPFEAVGMLLFMGVLFIAASRSCISDTAQPSKIVPAGASSSPSTVKSPGHTKPVLSRVELNRELVSACEKDNVETMKSLLAQGADPNVIDDVGVPVIFTSAYHGNGDMVRLLVKAGADVNAVTSVGQSTALMAASFRGDVQMVRMLLSCGASVDWTNVRGDTAMALAAKHRHSDVAAILKAAQKRGP
jgi:5-methylcytosine-specific restriction endonuclease McrA